MENNNHIELKPVKDLLGKNFFIPGYQRGYRWKTRQVQDLLDDIQDFIDKGADGKYCLQPLVVKKHKVDERNVCEEIKTALEKEDGLARAKELLQDQWDVVDGQQRLTTVFILLQYLSNSIKEGVALYSINYETRENSREFLCKIDKQEAVQYIDYTHIFNTQKVIDNWFNTERKKDSLGGQESKPEKPNKQVFLRTLLHQTEFIWYELTEEQKPIEVFTRLNIGKISLTNAELVKALLLNKLNFTDGRLSANEVALVWDQMEYTLQNDRFWCFIHEEGFSQPTRIDFLLELVMEIRNPKKENNSDANNNFWFVEQKDLGNDRYRTFRYFYQLLLKKTSPNDEKTPFRLVWDEIVRLFELLKEWYNDNECYHYIGFLTTWQERKKAKGKSLVTYIEGWQKKGKKEDFVKECLVKQIRDGIKDVKNLEQQYEIEENGKSKSKTACYPLLLLFNVQTIVDENDRFEQAEKFNALSFERFPFDLFKKEKGWDIEHIASNADNSIQSVEEAIEWLNSVVVGLVDAEKKQAAVAELERLKSNSDKMELDEQFYLLCRTLDGSNLDSKAKNKIWNFCLLDQSTNRGYGNSIFAIKRKWILNRERGLDVEGKPLSEDKKVYIPVCTLRVFTKFYSPDATDLIAWKKEDAKDYKEALNKTLKKFLQ